MLRFELDKLQVAVWSCSSLLHPLDLKLQLQAYAASVRYSLLLQYRNVATISQRYCDDMLYRIMRYTKRYLIAILFIATLSQLYRLLQIKAIYILRTLWGCAMIAPEPQANMISQPLKRVAYGVFTGEITEDAVQRITSKLIQFTHPQAAIESIHLLFHSTGGQVRDGVALHNFFQAFPLDLILYNGGEVGSAAVSAFLGARQRRASIHSAFAIHRSFMVISDGKPASDLQQLVNMMLIQDEQTVAIFRKAGVKLTDAQWADFTNNKDLPFSAKEAKETGFVQEIVEFSPPPGTTLFSL
jgi:ATP-dependent protease ClpP protease subunit